MDDLKDAQKVVDEMKEERSRLMRQIADRQAKVEELSKVDDRKYRDQITNLQRQITELEIEVE